MDESQNTSVKNIYALGDVAGKKLLTLGEGVWGVRECVGGCEGVRLVECDSCGCDGVRVVEYNGGDCEDGESVRMVWSVVGCECMGCGWTSGVTTMPLYIVLLLPTPPPPPPTPHTHLS